MRKLKGDFQCFENLFYPAIKVHNKQYAFLPLARGPESDNKYGSIYAFQDERGHDNMKLAFDFMDRSRELATGTTKLSAKEVENVVKGMRTEWYADVCKNYDMQRNNGLHFAKEFLAKLGVACPVLPLGELHAGAFPNTGELVSVFNAHIQVVKAQEKDNTETKKFR